MKASKVSICSALVAASLLSSPSIGEAQILNTQQISQLTLGNDTSTHDLWAENNYIYDLSVPGSPVELGRLEWGAGAWWHLGANAHIVDISDRSNPVQTGWFDTDPGAAGFNTNGTYGVYPFESNVYLSHCEDGLYIIGEVSPPGRSLGRR